MLFKKKDDISIILIMNENLIKGSVTKSLLLFALPMILGNMLQQLYNVADTFIGLLFYSDDIFEFNHFRSLYGKWGPFFHVIWS